MGLDMAFGLGLVRRGFGGRFGDSVCAVLGGGMGRS